jgi:pseudouridylate synthase / pseudouridine kinase
MSEVDILVAGSVAMDLSCDYVPLDANCSASLVSHTSNPAVISQAVGGVGRNVATAAHLIENGTSVRLCSIVANDLAGKIILSSLKEGGLDISSIRTLNADAENLERTAQYVAVNDANNDLVMAMADMRIISSPQRDFTLWKSIVETSKPKWVVVDANWDGSIMLQWMIEAKRAGANVAFEPVSVPKSSKLFPSMGSMSKNTPSAE